MDMQDKEFDRLLQSKLDELEIQPSKNVWQGISAGLENGNRKRSMAAILSMAAGVILLITIGLLFIRPVKTDQTANKLTKNNKPFKRANIIKNAPAIVAIAPKNITPAKPVTAHASALVPSNKITVKQAAATFKPLQHTDEKVTDSKTDEPAILASAVGVDHIQPAVPDTGTRIILKPADEYKALTIKPALASISNLPVAEQPDVSPVKKRRIRSFGDVLNVMIAAVDKRKDKIIQFSNTDEDDATITGVNLGIISIKKEQ